MKYDTFRYDTIEGENGRLNLGVQTLKVSQKLRLTMML